MSIMQNYEKHGRDMGIETIIAIDDYIESQQKIGNYISYSDVIYNKNYYELFQKWVAKKREIYSVVQSRYGKGREGNN